MGPTQTNAHTCTACGASVVAANVYRRHDFYSQDFKSVLTGDFAQQHFQAICNRSAQNAFAVALVSSLVESKPEGS